MPTSDEVERYACDTLKATNEIYLILSTTRPQFRPFVNGKIISQSFINKDRSCSLYLSTIKAVITSQLQRALLTAYGN